MLLGVIVFIQISNAMARAFSDIEALIGRSKASCTRLLPTPWRSTSTLPKPVCFAITIHTSDIGAGINGLAQVFFVTFIPMAFVSPWMFVRFGLRKTLILSAVLNAV